MRRDSAVAWEKFQLRLGELGAQLLEERWLGTKVPHRAICAAGHECNPRPGDVNRGTGLCVVCAGKDQATAWSTFCRLVEKAGGQVLEPRPLGVSTPHRIRCSKGHETVATPSYVRIGGGLCNICGLTSTVRAEAQFRELVAALGGEVIEPLWKGTKEPHRVFCGQGHETLRRPNDLQQTGSLCSVYAGRDSAFAWQGFQRLVAGQGGQVLDAAWLGNKRLHRIRCAKGHETKVRPNNIQQGSGICRTCAYKVWDVFYVVANDLLGTVKFGITSHDARSRLRTHRTGGYDRIIKTITSLPNANDLERAVISGLRDAGMVPVRGREYYDLRALPTIVSIADAWTAR